MHDVELPSAASLTIATVGPATVPSPIAGGTFVDEDNRILVPGTTKELSACELPPSFEAAGPRARLRFDPGKTRCGIVTCGGLCPGVNDVIRAIVLTLRYTYGVESVLGFPYGFAGLGTNPPTEPIALTTEVVGQIHNHGGTLLATSRGPQDVTEMVDNARAHGVDVLFAIGGDGTLRGASALAEDAIHRGIPMSVIGIPKTIDNDLMWIERSFGFSTAVEEACRAIKGAHAEARGAWNGVGLVKLMGRHSGFIAAHATLACSDVNFCLVPEVPFALDGEAGFMATLHRRLQARRHAVVVVAEGAGQGLVGGGDAGQDPSGNARLKDVGVFLRDQMVEEFARRGESITVKYIDPSYTVRSLPANALDSEFCLLLGQHAVHAGLAGRTDMLVGYWNQRFTHVPIAVATSQRKRIDPTGDLWRSVLQATGQPASM